MSPTRDRMEEERAERQAERQAERRRNAYFRRHRLNNYANMPRERHERERFPHIAPSQEEANARVINGGHAERYSREDAQMLANHEPNAPLRIHGERPVPPFQRRSPRESRHFSHLAPSQEEANARVRNSRVSHPAILMPGPAGIRKSSSPKESPSARLTRYRGINDINHELAQRGLIPAGTDYMLPTGTPSPVLRQAARQASRASQASSRASQAMQELSDTLINMAQHNDNDFEMTDAEDDVEIVRPASRQFSWDPQDDIEINRPALRQISFDARLANSTIDHNAPLFPGPADRRATTPDYRQPQTPPPRPRRLGVLDAIGDRARRVKKAIKQVGRRPSTPKQHVWARTNQDPVDRPPPRSRAQRYTDAEENYLNVTRAVTPPSPTPGAGRGRQATFFDRMENHGL